MSHPMQYMPVRSNDVATSPPRPVRSRLRSAALIPATIVMPVTWSPRPLRMPGGSSPCGTSDWAIDERAQNTPTS